MYVTTRVSKQDVYEMYYEDVRTTRSFYFYNLLRHHAISLLLQEAIKNQDGLSHLVCMRQIVYKDPKKITK